MTDDEMACNIERHLNDKFKGQPYTIVGEMIIDQELSYFLLDTEFEGLGKFFSTNITLSSDSVRIYDIMVNVGFSKNALFMSLQVQTDFDRKRMLTGVLKELSYFTRDFDIIKTIGNFNYEHHELVDE